VLLSLALPGGTYLYQGEELGLPEVEDLPVEALQDPTWERSGHTARGRDGCRVPMPWGGDRPPYGFTAVGVDPWLPQPDTWRDLTVEAQQADPASMWWLYHDALRLRRSLEALASEQFSWHGDDPQLLAFDRGPGFRCVVNFGPAPAPLPSAATVLLASTPLRSGDPLPPDAAVWLRPAESRIPPEPGHR
jgi:alpha-glucosidase